MSTITSTRHHRRYPRKPLRPCQSPPTAHRTPPRGSRAVKPTPAPARPPGRPPTVGALVVALVVGDAHAARAAAVAQRVAAKQPPRSAGGVRVEALRLKMSGRGGGECRKQSVCRRVAVCGRGQRGAAGAPQGPAATAGWGPVTVAQPYRTPRGILLNWNFLLPFQGTKLGCRAKDKRWPTWCLPQFAQPLHGMYVTVLPVSIITL